MNLGQMLMVTGAIVLLGILVLNANSTVYQANDTMYESEFGVTAISLATSVVEEAMGKMFDANVAATNTPAVYDSTFLTPPGSLNPEAGEAYHSPGHDFNDFDDFNGLQLCYHSDAPSEADATPGFRQMPIPGMRGKYFLTCTVTYVNPPNLDVPYMVRQTWHKKITVTVWSSYKNAVTDLPDTLVYPAIMSYWN